MSEGDIFCDSCGESKSGSIKVCSYCSKEIKFNEVICKHCGNSVVEDNLRSEVQIREYAGFWKRFAAIIIDSIVLMVVGVIAGGFVGVLFANNAESVGSFMGLLINFLYFTIMHASEKQATLGKMSLGIVLTDLEGNRLTYGKSVGRWFADIFSVLTLGIGFIMAGLTSKKQALHDIICNTLVVNKRI